MEKKYEIVTATIREWITGGRYQIEDKLPTESKLMSQFQVSRHTVRKSLSDLEVQGFIYRIQGGGSFVADYKHNANRSEAHTKTVAVLTTHITDYIFPAIISGIESQLSANAISMLLSSTQNDETLERKNLEKFLDDDIQGVIVEPTKSAFTIQNEAFYKRFTDAHIPILTIDAKSNNETIPYFIMDDFKGGVMAAQALIDAGHEHILGVFKSDDQQGILRMNGFSEALQKSQGSIRGEVLLYQSETGEAKLKQQITHILQETDPPTGIVGYNDQIALVAYNAARAAGLQVPDDVSLVGFDNSLLASRLGIRLTSINHPKSQMGKDAAELMIKMLQDPLHDFSDEAKIYPPEMVTGDSVRPVLGAHDQASGE